jgi:hypothetical protein
MGVFEHTDMILMIFIPIITCAFAFGGAAFAFKNNTKLLEELRFVIENLEKKIACMESRYLTDMKNIVTIDRCEAESASCQKNRDNSRSALEKKLDEFHADLTVQDMKRHEQNNKSHAHWMEISERLAGISATLELMKLTYSLHENVLSAHSDHTGRIEELEKRIRHSTSNANVSMPHGRRATDVKDRDKQLMSQMTNETE